VQVNQMTIREFARHSRLSPRALRLYDELGLLKPAQVDEDQSSMAERRKRIPPVAASASAPCSSRDCGVASAADAVV
jgi:hypothetical protein